MIFVYIFSSKDLKLKIIFIFLDKTMATQDDVSNITTSFHTSFPNSGFLVLDTNCQVESMGEVLINYKGLKIIKFDKSQILEGDYDPVKFNNTCHERCKGPNPVQEIN